MPNLYELTLRAVNYLKVRSGLVTSKTHTFYARALDDKSVVVDLGANVGEFASTIVARFGATCHALEAIQSLFDQIPTTQPVKKYNLAISDRNGPVLLFGSVNRECNSIHSSIAKIFGLRDTEMCTGTTLQNFLNTQGIERVDLLKVDIEGSEDLLFSSTPDHVLQNIRQITAEFHDFIPGSISSEAVSRIITRLKSLGFYCIPFSYLYPDMLNADLLFIQSRSIGATLAERGCFVALSALLNLQRTKSHYFRKRRNALADQGLLVPRKRRESGHA